MKLDIDVSAISAGPAPSVVHPRGVIAHPSGHAWMLQGPASSLVIAIGKTGAVVQRYWGPRLGDADLDVVVDDQRDRWNSSFERPAELDEQLPVHGGLRWGLPALQARFADGLRSLELRFERAETTDRALTLHLADDTAGIRVELRYRTHADDDVVDRTVTVHNDGAEDLRLTRFDSGNWLLPDLPAYRVTTAHGHWGGEGQVQRLPLPRGEYRIGSRQGVTGHVANPWMMIDAGDATEQSGEVWSLALAWSGSWHITAQSRAEGMVSVGGGWSQEGVEFRVPPSGSLTTPVISGMFSPHGFGGTSRAWHDVVRRRVLPHGGRLRPVVYNSWEATEFDIDMATELELAECAASLGVELFVVDDGWFHGRHHDRAGLGDWWADPSKFPDGLRPLADRVHDLGMRFGVWVEPEMINVDSDLHRTHPEWVQQWPDHPGSEIRNQKVLDFGRTEVQQYVLGLLTQLIDENRIDFVKWDMNRPFTDTGSTVGPHDSDQIWRTHTDGVYRVMDELRDRYPDLVVEGCASGGARVDLGILHRVDQVWTSDNTDALDRQTIQDGHTQIYPASTMAAWVTDHRNIVSRRVIPLEYRFHVAMAGALGIGADIRTWTDAERDQARDLIARYKVIRPTVQLGDLHRLDGEPGHGQSAVQYTDRDRVVVLAYDPHRSLSPAPRRIRLRDLDPSAVYRDTETGERFTGSYLTGRGIRANRDRNDRGWDNLRFSNHDYVSTLTVLERCDDASTVPSG